MPRQEHSRASQPFDGRQALGLSSIGDSAKAVSCSPH
jgi:hypothetical protein